MGLLIAKVNLHICGLRSLRSENRPLHWKKDALNHERMERMRRKAHIWTFFCQKTVSFCNCCVNVCEAGLRCLLLDVPVFCSCIVMGFVWGSMLVVGILCFASTYSLFFHTTSHQIVSLARMLFLYLFSWLLLLDYFILAILSFICMSLSCSYSLKLVWSFILICGANVLCIR